MNWSKFHRYLPGMGLIARLYLGSVFLIASLHKIAYPGQFAIDVATYQLLPLVLVNPFALIVPWVEFFVGLALITGIFARGAALLAAELMISFMIALGYALHLGLQMSCGCFASQGAQSSDPISGWTMLRDLSWLLVAIFIVLVDTAPLGLSLLVPKRRES